MEKPKYIQIEIKEDSYEIHLIGESANFIFNPNTRNGEELSDFLSGCEEIPDPTNQLKADNIANTFLKPYEKEFLDCLEKLQADKEELLEALEKLRNHYGLFPENRIEIESLIQKHKQ